MPVRTIAIGDIHGCSRAFDSLLELIQPVPDDVVISLGDYVNRGPNARDVIEQLIALESKCTLIPLLGNHDQMLLDALTGRPQAFSIWMRMGGGSTLLSYGASPGGATRSELGRIPPEHVAFLKRCRPYHETDSHIFIHAKYDPELAMERQPDWLLRWETLRDGIPGPHVSGKLVIAGHTSQKNGEILDAGHLLCIDTYCHGGGWLSAFEAQTRQVWQADQQGRLRQP